MATKASPRIFEAVLLINIIARDSPVTNARVGGLVTCKVLRVSFWCRSVYYIKVQRFFSWPLLLGALFKPKTELTGSRGVTLFLCVPCMVYVLSGQLCGETRVLNAALMVGENPTLPGAAHFLLTIAAYPADARPPTQQKPSKVGFCFALAFVGFFETFTPASANRCLKL